MRSFVCVLCVVEVFVVALLRVGSDVGGKIVFLLFVVMSVQCACFLEKVRAGVVPSVVCVFCVLSLFCSSVR